MEAEEKAKDKGSSLKENNISRNIDGPLISIVIPTYNSSRTIVQCLESVRDQTYRNIEIIVCDNFSDDDTVDVARRYGARVLYKGWERAAQKNFGADHANGDILYFVDSDFVLEQDTVQRCVQYIGNADAVVTMNRSRGDRIWAKSIAYKRELLTDEESVIAARFLRRASFFKVGGFNEELIVGEDIDLHRRLVRAGFRVRRVDAVEWHVGEPETFRELVVRNYYYGKGLRKYLRENRRAIVGHLNPFKTAFIAGFLKNPSPLVISLAVVQITTYMTSLLGLLASWASFTRAT